MKVHGYSITKEKTFCGRIVKSGKVYISTNRATEITCKQCLGVQSPKQIEAQKNNRILGALGMMKAQVQTIRLLTGLTHFCALNDIEFFIELMKQRMKK